jgi:hypothetical protein
MANYSLFRKVGRNWLRIEGAGSYPKSTDVICHLCLALGYVWGLSYASCVVTKSPCTCNRGTNGCPISH